MDRFLELCACKAGMTPIYHHSRVNPVAPLVSAMSFMFSYVMVSRTRIAALVGWLVADDHPAGRGHSL